ncbi:MAG TPA: TonB-dependent receptor [Myxococcota bacterium]|nr:TonB-dependent receptor [Myxococcota bacterium]
MATAVRAQDTGGGSAPDTEEEIPESPKKPPAPPPSVEEIVVIGTESESASEFSSADSIIGFNAEDLAAIGAQSIQDLSLFTPNLEIVSSGATTPTFFVRGVGLNDFNPNSTGSVSIYQDNIAINAPALQLSTLFDTEAVNIERGPIGTGLARNSSAGAIRLYSRKPSGDYGGYLRADFGNYDFMDYEGAVEAPIFEDILSGRLAFRIAERDGTLTNNCANAPNPRVIGTDIVTVDRPVSVCGEPVTRGNFSDIPPGLDRNLNNINNWAARGTLQFQPAIEQTWLVGAHGSRRDELSRLGQSIGTGNFFCNDPNKVCEAPFVGIPPSQRTTQSQGLLGGPVNGDPYSANYVPKEIRDRLAELAPCFASPNPLACQLQPLAGRLAFNAAKVKLAQELADNLDSKPWKGDFNLTGPTTNDTYGGFVNGNLNLPGDFQLSLNSGYDSYDRHINIDLDMSPETLFQIDTKDDAWQFYQDFNLSREVFSDTFPIRLDFGGWVLRENLEANVHNNLGDASVAGVKNRDYQQQDLSTAGYGSFAFDFWNDFTLDGGFRYNWDNKHLHMVVVPFTPTPGTSGQSKFKFDDIWHAPTGTLRLTYRFREDTHWYWKYTHGWKPGTYNATASQFTGPTVANPENIDSFETGLRGAWFDGMLGLDTSLFYYQYKDYQIFTARQFLGGTPEFVVLNANNAEVYGAEVEGTSRPWEGGFFDLRFSWLESSFLDFVQTDQFLAATGGTTNPVRFKDTQNTGHPLLNSPKYKVSITAEQTVPLGRTGYGTFRYDGAWTDTTYFDPSKGRGVGDLNGNKFLPSDTIAQQPFWIHNIRVGWRSPDQRIEVAGWVRNLANQEYKTFAFDGSTFRSTTIYYIGDPRTYGASLFFTF